MGMPLNELFDFCREYKRLIINAKHGLIIQWRMRRHMLSDVHELNLLQVVDSGKSIQIRFRCWNWHEMPLVPKTITYLWPIRTSSYLE